MIAEKMRARLFICLVRAVQKALMMNVFISVYNCICISNLIDLLLTAAIALADWHPCQIIVDVFTLLKAGERSIYLLRLYPHLL